MNYTVNIPGKPAGHGSYIRTLGRALNRIPISNPVSILGIALLG